MELLAPAGSMEALKAAVENGADAVYLGGKLFNARKKAANFSIEEIAEAVKYAHLRGVRIYITVNILLADNEFVEVVNYLDELMKCNVDAILIQDLGLLNICKNIFPELPIHASTQMTIHNSCGAAWYAKENLERIVLARELSLDEIKNIARETSIELETFVHGALCISYSGQCLFSSMVGGRSGNRGRCAQPCRMSYRLIRDDNTQVLTEDLGEHLLSPKDLNTVELLPKLDEAGITSLKIEGRMKRPEYVATVVRIYRSVLNRMITGESFSVEKQEKKDLTQIFNRDFTSGYFLFNPGKNLMSYKRPNNRGTFLGRIVDNDRKYRQLTIKLEDELSQGDGIEIWVTKGGREGFVVSNINLNGKVVTEAKKGDNVSIPFDGYAYPGDRIFKTLDVRLQTLAKESYLKLSQKRIAVDAKIEISMGSPMLLVLKDEDGNEASVEGSVPAQEARTTPLTEETLLKQLDRLGNTAFVLKTWTVSLTPQTMLPVSELNAIRREAVTKLEEVRLFKYKRYQIDDHISVNECLKQTEKIKINQSEKHPGIPKLAISVSDYEGLLAALTADPDIIYLGGEQFRKGKVLTKDEMAKALKIALKKEVALVFALPRIWHDHENKYLAERVKIAADIGIKSFQVSTPAGIGFIRENVPEAEIYADYYFNIFNSYALKYVVSKDVKIAALSPELTLAQLHNIKGINQYGECLIYGAIPLMVSEHCLIGSTIGGRTETTTCSMPCNKGKYFLQDRLNLKFPVIADLACRMHIYNAKVLNLLPNLKEIINASPAALRLDLRVENPEAIQIIAQLFSKAVRMLAAGKEIDPEGLQQKLAAFNTQGYTKGHYFRGVLDTED